MLIVKQLESAVQCWQHYFYKSIVTKLKPSSKLLFSSKAKFEQSLLPQETEFYINQNYLKHNLHQTTTENHKETNRQNAKTFHKQLPQDGEKCLGKRSITEPHPSCNYNPMQLNQNPIVFTTLPLPPNHVPQS